MKNLALLCNLHAEGPATLAVLRRDGCEGLSALLEYEVRDLARLLDWDDGLAERFLREGAELSERLQEGLLEPEAQAEDPLEPDGAELDPEHEVGLEAPGSDSRRRVLEAWRGLDRSHPPGPPGDGFVLPRPEPAARSATALRALGLDGVSPELLRRLAEAGITTVEELEQRPALELASGLGLGLTRVLRLCFLVRRATGAHGVTPDTAPAPH